MLASAGFQPPFLCHSCTQFPDRQTDRQMNIATERIKVPPAVSTVVWAEIKDEVMGKLQSDRHLLLKDRVKSFTQSIYEHCKEKLSIAT